MKEELELKEKSIKRKEWVKTAIIVFLAIMLVLTFFSNTIMNYSLPEVATDYVQSDSITAKVRGTGTVEANDPYNVSITENREISGVAVKNGDVVEKGQVLFYLSDKENEELKTLKDTLAAQQLAYNQALLAEGISSNVYNNVQNGTISDTGTYQARIQAAKNKVAEAQKVVNTYQTQVDNLNNQLNLSGAGVADVASATALLNSANTNLNSAQAALDDYNRRLTALDAAGAGGGGTSGTTGDTMTRDQLVAAIASQTTTVNNCKTAVTTAQSALNLCQQKAAAENNLNVAKTNLTAQQDALTALQGDVQNELTLSGQRQTILDLEAQIEELEADSVGGTVVAPVSGTVNGVTHVSGETTTAGETLATIIQEGKGYTLSFSVSNQQAASVNIGDKGEISNSWYYSDVVPTLTSIKPDPNSPTANKMLTFTLEGEVSNGQSFTISVGQKSANYEFTVPNSTIREDKDGKFILIVEIKPSPLGNRYFATRVDVDVLASDDKRSAINPTTYEMYGYEYVITTSTQPIEAGQQIRLTE